MLGATIIAATVVPPGTHDERSCAGVESVLWAQLATEELDPKAPPVEPDHEGRTNSRPGSSAEAPLAKRGPPTSWQVTALVDTGYAFNSNLPANHLYRGTATPPRTDESTVNVGAAALTHVQRGFFYRGDATAGDASELASDQYPVFVHVAEVVTHAFSPKKSDDN